MIGIGHRSGNNDALARENVCLLCGATLTCMHTDASLPDAHNGAICSGRLAWLKPTLEEAPDQPTLQFMHHPPFMTGIWWMGGIGIVEGVAGLREVLNGHPQVQRIVCGHVHRAIQANLGRTPVSVCPSTSYQVYLNLHPGSPPKLIAEPPAMQLHTWTGELIVSHTAYLDFPAEPIDLRPLMGNRDEGRERTRSGLRIPKVVRY